MSGRRAKQRRRMVVMAEDGDRVARAWCLAHMTRGQIRRTSQRMKDVQTSSPDLQEDEQEETP